MTNEEIFQNAAEKRWKEIGERHGYSGVVHGAAEVLRRHGFDTTGDELASVYHDPLSEFHGSMERGEAQFARIAKTMSYGSHGETNSTLPFPFNRIHESNQFPYPLDDAPQIKLNLGWIQSELEAYLKKEKIRKNTKRWNDTISMNAPRIIRAAEEDAEKAKIEALKKYEKNIKELDELHDKALAGVQGVERRSQIRRAFIEAAEIPPNVNVEEANEKRLAAWRDVVTKIEEHAAYLERSVSEIDPKAAAIDAMAWNKILRPFLDAAGISYNLPSWAS